MIDAAARAKLLALDRRFPRMASDPTHREKQWRAQIDNIRERFQLQAALRQLLAWHDAPPQGWTAGMIRRLEQIRGLADRQ